MGLIRYRQEARRRLRHLAAVALASTLLLSTCQRAQASFSDELWNDIRPLYSETLKHPFLTGLSDGSLPRSRFEYYLVQDVHYLRAFAKVLSALAAKAPLAEWALVLDEHAQNALQAEQELHKDLLEAYGISAEQISNVPMAPTNYAYTNHLLAIAYEKPFAHGLAAVLPCYWIYWEVGKDLRKAGSTNRDYQRWIDQYSSDGFGHAVEEVLEMINTEAKSLSTPVRKELKEIFRTSTRYEWMFLGHGLARREMAAVRDVGNGEA